MSRRWTMWSGLTFAALLTGCGIQSAAAIDEIRGTVEVVEQGRLYQRVDVTGDGVSVSLLVQPPYAWQAGRCYTIHYVDPTGAEPRALSTQACE